ncbi:MAG: 2-oxo acid dehydrogenase subunit E2 [Clostridiales bacterium]|nr:2-oxo acid dehydrogenase subunit E2 [Clostridiales bacterium]
MKASKKIPFGIERKIISHITTESWRNVPHVCFVYEADATGLMEEFKDLPQPGREKVNFNTLLLRVIVEAIKAAPQVNAHIHYNRHTTAGFIDQLENIDISMPWLLDDGKMMTVNLRDFGNKSLVEMAVCIADVRRRIKCTNLELAMLDVSLRETLSLARQGRFIEVLRRCWGAFAGKNRLRRFSRNEVKRHRAMPREDKLGVQDLERGSIAVSNIGASIRGLSGLMSILEIIPPQIFAIGISAVQEKPSAVDGADGNKVIEIRKIMPICLSFDHRALDFGDVAPFIHALDNVFKNPELIHGWL